MISRPVAIINSFKISTTTKRKLFRLALCIGMIGSILVSSILLLQGGLALGYLRYSMDIGQYSLHLSSVFLIIFGLLAILTFIILTIGLIQMKRAFAVIAIVLLIICSLGLISFSIYSFVIISSKQLPQSIHRILINELNQTRFSIGTENNIIVDNSYKMALLEKQHQCCGLTNPIEDYRNLELLIFRSTSLRSRNTKERIQNYQRNSFKFGSSVLLPISCCNEKYRSNENHLCIDIYKNNTNLLDRYNTEGCYTVIFREKIQRIQQQGSTAIIAASLALISCIALVAVVRLLNEDYQVEPLRTTA